MAEAILMPRLSDTMTEGVVAIWHKNIGDTVKKGDLLAEIETDKATMDLESYKEGTLLHIGIDKGGKLQVDDLLAIVGHPGEDISSLIKRKDSSKEKNSEATKKESVSTTPPLEAIAFSNMEEVVLMPRLNDTMQEGLVAAWHKNLGDPVKKGDVLAEIETDKATMDLESYKNGFVLYIGAKKGEKIPVNSLLCIIGDKEKVAVEAIVAAFKNRAADAEKISNPVPVTEKAKQTLVADSTPAPIPSDDNARTKASPLAKKIASEKGIDIKTISGSGDGGRIIKADIDTYKPAQQTTTSLGGSPNASTNPPVFAARQEGYTDIPNSPMRSIVARRLSESKFSAPHFYLTIEISMDNAITARSQLNEISPAKISFNDMIVKAAALALRQHPAVNASWLGDKIRRHHHIHIGIAVAIEDGLIVPVVRFADQKTLPQIAAESKQLAAKAKSKKLHPEEFTGNTFTISNLGMMDIDEFTAIINPPDSCIMAVGKIKEIVVKKADHFSVSNVIKITLSCDHRSVDGAVGAAFLQTVKKYLESPITMLL